MRIIGLNRMYERRAKAQMILCACHRVTFVRLLCVDRYINSFNRHFKIFAEANADEKCAFIGRNFPSSNNDDVDV